MARSPVWKEKLLAERTLSRSTSRSCRWRRAGGIQSWSCSDRACSLWVDLHHVCTEVGILCLHNLLRSVFEFPPAGREHIWGASEGPPAALGPIREPQAQHSKLHGLSEELLRHNIRWRTAAVQLFLELNWRIDFNINAMRENTWDSNMWILFPQKNAIYMFYSRKTSSTGWFQFIYTIVHHPALAHVHAVKSLLLPLLYPIAQCVCLYLRLVFI